MNTTAAIFARLQEVWPRLDDYLGQPAVFNDRAPDEYLVNQQSPCIVIAAPDDDVESGTFTESGRAILQEVRLYGRDTGSSEEIDNLARDLRDLFQDRPADVVVAGARTVICQASGPTPSPTTDPSLIGRRISLRIELQRI